MEGSCSTGQSPQRAVPVEKKKRRDFQCLEFIKFIINNIFAFFLNAESNK
jgi:hypothetical protein